MSLTRVSKSTFNKWMDQGHGEMTAYFVDEQYLGNIFPIYTPGWYTLRWMSVKITSVTPNPDDSNTYKFDVLRTWFGDLTTEIEPEGFLYDYFGVF